MSLELEILYLPLQGLTKKSDSIYIARCPICGDSKKDISKKRFYILFSRKQTYCQNCHYNNSIHGFIKENYPDVYKQYWKENFAKKRVAPPKIPKVPKEILNRQEGMKKTKRILKKAKPYGLTDKLPEHIIKYLEGRCLDPKRFMFMERYVGFVKDYQEEAIPLFSDPRIVIPYIKKSNRELYAMQGRATKEGQKPKYLTVKFTEDMGKIYNIYNIDPDKTVYVLEGPIDSMFLPNAVALSGANISDSILKEFKKFKDVVFIFDSDFVYNPDIRAIIKKVISYGYGIYIPSKKLSIHKDINDIVIDAGIKDKELVSEIENRTFKGIVALTMLAKYPIKTDPIKEKEKYVKNTASR